MGESGPRASRGEPRASRPEGEASDLAGAAASEEQFVGVHETAFLFPGPVFAQVGGVALSTTRTTFTLEESLVEDARRPGINISAAARDGVAAAVRDALAKSDRAAYEHHPENPDSYWTAAEAWGKE